MKGDHIFCSFVNALARMYTPFPNNRGGLNEKGGPTDNLNINKRGVQIKGGGGLKNVS